MALDWRRSLLHFGFLCSFTASFKQVMATGEPAPGGPDSCPLVEAPPLPLCKRLMRSCPQHEHPSPVFRGVLNDGWKRQARSSTGEGPSRDY